MNSNSKTFRLASGLSDAGRFFLANFPLRLVRIPAFFAPVTTPEWVSYDGIAFDKN